MSTKLPLLFDELALDTLDSDSRRRINAVDAVLPQTQCGLCGYRDGCLPYAHAIVTTGEAINLCVPGGDSTALAISQLTDRPYTPAVDSKHPIDPKTQRPQAMYAVIDEAVCIGCTKCIPACPVDAIIGTGKHMHSILPALCTGCELCLAPCPVDCISLQPLPIKPLSNEERALEQAHLRKRYHAHLHRLTASLEANQLTVASHTEAKLANTLQSHANTTAIDSDTAKTTLQLAKLRSQIKKLDKQLKLRADPAKQAELQRLQAQLTTLTTKN